MSATAPSQILRRASIVLVATGVLTGTAGLAVAASPSYAPVQRTNIDRAVPAGATLLPSGRLVSPAGRKLGLGDFPEGVALSPDGVLAVASGVGQGDGTLHGDFGDLCVDGQHKKPCAASGRFPKPRAVPDEALFVTNLRTGSFTAIRTPQGRCNPKAAATVKTLHCQELGVTFSPDGKHLYATGGGNDAVMDFLVTGHVVASTPTKVVYLQEVNPAPGGAGAYQSPNPGTQAARTKGLAVTPDGQHLLVAKEQSGTLDVLSTATMSLQQRITFGAANPTASNGSVTYPYAVVVAPDGRTAYVSLQGTGQIAALSLTATPAGLQAGPPVLVPAGDHPTGLAVSPDSGTLVVANANDDTVTVFPLASGLPRPAATLTVRARPSDPNGSVPDAVVFDGNNRVYVALAGDNAVAALERKGTGAFAVAGLVPTGWYPTAVAVRAGTHELVTVAAKGLGSGYTKNGGYAPAPLRGPQAVTPFYYDGDNMPGLLTVVPSPTKAALVAGRATVLRNTDFANGSAAGVHGPVPTDPARAGTSPITHVVYIVRENRTYDQVYGDLAKARNDVDADPAFESLSSATPQGHKLTGRYASSDSFFSDGEASVQGHYWTTSANVDDYVEKAWRQYYSDRNHSSDSVGTTISAPKNCSIFQAAQAKSSDPSAPFFDPSFTYQDDGDPVGLYNPSLAPGSVPGLTPTGSGTAPAQRTACGAIPAANADVSNFGDFLGLDDRDGAKRFLAQAGLTTGGAAVPGATATLRNFTYLELPNDHTTGFTRQGPTNIEGHTPRAQIAENDAAVGTVISALSKSSYWPSTAVFVVEDDSQDAPDHVDGHRNVLLVASPYARQVSANGCYGGYVGHAHHDQAAVLRTIELILGLPALSSYDQNAAPLYDLFQNKSSAAQLTKQDLAPYDLAPAPAFLEEKVGDPSAGTAASQAALQQASATLDLSGIDRAGPGLETVLARSVGAPPPVSREESNPAGTLVHAQIQQARLRTQAARTSCAPTVAGGATATGLLGGPRLLGAVRATPARGGAQPISATASQLATTGMPQTLGLISLTALVLGVLGWRRSRRI